MKKMKKLFYVTLILFITITGIIAAVQKPENPEYAIIIFSLGGITVGGLHLATTYTRRQYGRID
jgi:hypothetical protein